MNNEIECEGCKHNWPFVATYHHKVPHQEIYVECANEKQSLQGHGGITTRDSDLRRQLEEAKEERKRLRGIITDWQKQWSRFLPKLQQAEAELASLRRQLDEAKSELNHIVTALQSHGYKVRPEAIAILQAT